MAFYTIPLNPANLMVARDLKKVEIRESIHENIRLILRSFFLSYRYDPSFGSLINRFQGSTRPNTTRDVLWRAEIKRQIQNNLEDMLKRYENRVQVDSVVVNLVNPGKKSKNGEVQVRVEVKGNLSLGMRERFHFPDREIVDEAQEVFPLTIPIGKN